MMSIVFLKRKLYRHHWTALCCIVGGIAIVGLAVTLHKSTDDNEYNMFFGITLMVIAQIFHGGMYISEEKFFGDYYLHPFYIVGWEGIWGLLFYFYFLLIT